MVLDIKDFIKDQGGNPEAIRESQRRRYAPESAVDDIINLFEDHKKSRSEIMISALYTSSLTNTSIAKYAATQINSKINSTQKEIGVKKKGSQQLIWSVELVSHTDYE